ncbi:MAG: BRCT domain-containing protein, partial [Microcystaceae cyanobacterium]
VAVAEPEAEAIAQESEIQEPAIQEPAIQEPAIQESEIQEPEISEIIELETLTPTPALASPEPTEAESPALAETSEPQPSIEPTKPAKKSSKLGKSTVSPAPVSPAPVSPADASLEGKRWIILGTLSLISRDRVKELITASGGTITSSPSGKTDYAIVGKAPGEKLKKAQKLGIAQLS